MIELFTVVQDIVAIIFFCGIVALTILGQGDLISKKRRIVFTVVAFIWSAAVVFAATFFPPEKFIVLILGSLILMWILDGIVILS